MWDFFWCTVILGFLKWGHGAFIKKEVDKLEIFALIYSVILFVILLVFQPKKTTTAPIKQIQRNPIEIHQNSELKKLQEKDRKWRESLGKGILDSI